ncbi:MAG: hypothetical protein O7B99_05300 [Planctomycetota bacterium]|nr:hypothetical protein [Planctomycetota bacterium]
MENGPPGGGGHRPGGQGGDVEGIEGHGERAGVGERVVQFLKKDLDARDQAAGLVDQRHGDVDHPVRVVVTGRHAPGRIGRGQLEERGERPVGVAPGDRDLVEEEVGFDEVLDAVGVVVHHQDVRQEPGREQEVPPQEEVGGQRIFAGSAPAAGGRDVGSRGAVA